MSATIKRCAALWREGADTAEIAYCLGTHEFRVYNSLTRIRSYVPKPRPYKRREADWRIRWCPPEYLPLYRQIRRKEVPAAEARRMVEAEMARAK